MNTYSDAPTKRPADLDKSIGGSPYSSPSAASGKVSVGNGAVDQAREMATDTAAAVGSQIKGMLDRQVGAGCDVMSTFAKSAMRAADDLNREAPQLAGLVRGAARRLDGLASDMHDQSVDQLMKSASDYTRRQPALVFGLAAVAGFLALRTMKNASSGKSLSQDVGPHGATSHGA